MYTVTYYKLGNRWYLDLPDYIDRGGNPDDLERIGAFRDFLEAVSNGETTLCFHMATQPFDGADYLELTQSTGEKSGGYYHLHTFNGAHVDLELWMNAVLFFTQDTLPQRIYLKKVSPSVNNVKA